MFTSIICIPISIKLVNYSLLINKYIITGIPQLNYNKYAKQGRIAIKE